MPKNTWWMFKKLKKKLISPSKISEIQCFGYALSKPIKRCLDTKSGKFVKNSSISRLKMVELPGENSYFNFYTFWRWNITIRCDFNKLISCHKNWNSPVSEIPDLYRSVTRIEFINYVNTSKWTQLNEPGIKMWYFSDPPWCKCIK